MANHNVQVAIVELYTPSLNPAGHSVPPSRLQLELVKTGKSLLLSTLQRMSSGCSAVSTSKTSDRMRDNKDTRAFKTGHQHNARRYGWVRFLCRAAVLSGNPEQNNASSKSSTDTSTFIGILQAEVTKIQIQHMLPTILSKSRLRFFVHTGSPPTNLVISKLPCVGNSDGSFISRATRSKGTWANTWLKNDTSCPLE